MRNKNLSNIVKIWCYPIYQWGGVLSVALALIGSFPSVAQSEVQPWRQSGQVRVCMVIPGLQNRQKTLKGDMALMLIVPSGTVFVYYVPPSIKLIKHSKQPSHQSSGQSSTQQPLEQTSGQALVTTETVTLTAGQPCAAADAASLRSHTRNWLTVPVRPVKQGTFFAIGRVRGNGVETDLYGEDDFFRTIVRSGELRATPEGVLGEVIDLQETAADLPTVSSDNPNDPDSMNIRQIEHDMTNNLPPENTNKENPNGNTNKKSTNINTTINQDMNKGLNENAYNMNTNSTNNVNNTPNLQNLQKKSSEIPFQKPSENHSSVHPIRHHVHHHVKHRNHKVHRKMLHKQEQK